MFGFWVKVSAAKLIVCPGEVYKKSCIGYQIPVNARLLIYFATLLPPEAGKDVFLILKVLVVEFVSCLRRGLAKGFAVAACKVGGGGESCFVGYFGYAFVGSLYEKLSLPEA